MLAGLHPGLCSPPPQDRTGQDRRAASGSAAAVPLLLPLLLSRNAAVQMQLRHILITTLEGQPGAIESRPVGSTAEPGLVEKEREEGQRSMGNLPAANVA